MAARALIFYSGTTGTVTLTVEQSTSGTAKAFDLATVEQWAVDNKPSGVDLVSVRFSPEYEDVYP